MPDDPARLSYEAALTLLELAPGWYSTLCRTELCRESTLAVIEGHDMMIMTTWTAAMTMRMMTILTTSLITTAMSIAMRQW